METQLWKNQFINSTNERSWSYTISGSKGQFLIKGQRNPIFKKCNRFSVSKTNITFLCWSIDKYCIGNQNLSRDPRKHRRNFHNGRRFKRLEFRNYKNLVIWVVYVYKYFISSQREYNANCWVQRLQRSWSSLYRSELDYTEKNDASFECRWKLAHFISMTNISIFQSIRMNHNEEKLSPFIFYLRIGDSMS